MRYSNGLLSFPTFKYDINGKGEKDDPGVSFNLSEEGDYDMENKKMVMEKMMLLQKDKSKGMSVIKLNILMVFYLLKFLIIKPLFTALLVAYIATDSISAIKMVKRYILLAILRI